MLTHNTLIIVIINELINIFKFQKKQKERKTNNLCYHLYVESKRLIRQTNIYNKTETNSQIQRTN